MSNSPSLHKTPQLADHFLFNLGVVMDKELKQAVHTEAHTPPNTFCHRNLRQLSEAKTMEEGKREALPLEV